MADGSGIEPFGGVRGDDDRRAAPGFAAEYEALNVASGQNPGFCGPKIRYQCIEP